MGTITSTLPSDVIVYGLRSFFPWYEVMQLRRLRSDAREWILLPNLDSYISATLCRKYKTLTRLIAQVTNHSHQTHYFSRGSCSRCIQGVSFLKQSTEQLDDLLKVIQGRQSHTCKKLAHIMNM